MSNKVIVDDSKLKEIDASELKNIIANSNPVVLNTTEDTTEVEYSVGKYTKKALECLTNFMKRVTFLGNTVEEQDSLQLVNYTNILCRLANEIKYIEESEEIDNDFCSLMYDSGEVSELRSYFDWKDD